MPACELSCQFCGTRETRSLGDSDFRALLGEGIVQNPCAKCGEATDWKLVLPPRPEPQATPHAGPRRLLLIDDDPDTLRILQMMLHPQEYHVVTAESADQAIQRLQTEDYDVIVSDILMPGFDGRSLYRFLACFLPDYTSKVVFLTGDRSEKTLRFLRESSCPYSFKPIQLHELQSHIREIG